MRRVHSVDSQINLLSDSAAPKLEDLGRFTSAVPRRICTFSPKTDPTTSWDDATQNGCLFPHPIQSYFFNCYLCFSGRKKTSSFALSVESWIYKLQVARLQPLYDYIGLWDPPRPHVAILHCCRIPSTSPGQWCPQLVSKVAVAKSRN